MMEQAPIETVKPAIRMLSDAQIQAVHDSSLDILARTGIEMKSEAVADLSLSPEPWRWAMPNVWLASC